MLGFLGFQNKDLSILFVDNKKIATLNRKFFGKDKPTNVISFSYVDGLPCEVLGDIIISVERADEEARTAGTQFYERLFALIIHGFAHIMGYDHGNDAKKSREMASREKRFMNFVEADDTYKALTSKKS